LSDFSNSLFLSSNQIKKTNQFQEHPLRILNMPLIKFIKWPLVNQENKLCLSVNLTISRRQLICGRTYCRERVITIYYV